MKNYKREYPLYIEKTGNQEAYYGMHEISRFFYAFVF